jgi:hypothetical protein
LIQWHANLSKLCSELEDFARSESIALPDCSSSPASTLADSLYLAHSRSARIFGQICESGRLVSQERLAAEGVRPVPAGCASAELGTTASVFFYVAPFRYPSTACGFLFSSTLKPNHKDGASATPFDSGGLTSVFKEDLAAEAPRQFLKRHELPVPDHRRYLCLCMHALFESPMDYVDGIEPKLAGPIGLTRGDQRRWTHEVRVPDAVDLRGGHLQAVFAPKSRVKSDRRIRQFFEWCLIQNVDRIEFETARGDDFEMLRKECIRYVQQKLSLSR